MERLLRTYQHVAQKEHWCDVCCTYILPGDMYSAMVYVSKKQGIVTFRKHIEPCCDYPEDPDDKDEALDGLEHTLSGTKKEEAKKAA